MTTNPKLDKSAGLRATMKKSFAHNKSPATVEMIADIWAHFITVQDAMMATSMLAAVDRNDPLYFSRLAEAQHRLDESLKSVADGLKNLGDINYVNAGKINEQS